MELVGVTKATADYRVDEAQGKGIKVFCLNEIDRKPFEEAGYAVEGNLRKLLDGCDAVIDCAPKGNGEENLAIYGSYPKLKAIFQGGEKHELTGISFNSDCNYEQTAKAAAEGKRFLRVVSCNTTALCRIISTLNTNFQIRKVRACLVRRSADQSESDSSLLNSWQPDTSFPSHHSQDVKTVMRGISITSLAGVAPMTLMHGHMLFIELEKGSKPATVNGVIETLQRNPRILVCSSQKGLTSTAKLKDLFALHSNGRSSDLYEVCVWKEGVSVDADGEVGLHMAVDQQADVVPENIDAVRAMFSTMPAEESIALTNASLSIGKIVKNVVYVHK